MQKYIMLVFRRSSIFNMAILAEFFYRYSSNALSIKILVTICQTNWQPDSEIHMCEERHEISQSNLAEANHLISIRVIGLQSSIQQGADIDMLPSRTQWVQKKTRVRTADCWLRWKGKRMLFSRHNCSTNNHNKKLNQLWSTPCILNNKNRL